jgi:hypothetical protein
MRGLCSFFLQVLTILAMVASMCTGQSLVRDCGIARRLAWCRSFSLRSRSVRLGSVSSNLERSLSEGRAGVDRRDFVANGFPCSVRNAQEYGGRLGTDVKSRLTLHHIPRVSLGASLASVSCLRAE